MEEKYAMTILDKNTGKLVTRDTRTGEIIAEEGSTTPQFLYSLEMADAICNLVREGHTYKEIAAMNGMPPLHLIYSWRNAHPDFAKRLKDCRRDRATWFHDEAVTVIKDAATIEKDEVAREKFRFDGLMRLAEVGDADTYGKKGANHQGVGPTTIVINTGINREQIIEVQHEQIPSEEFGEDGRQQTDYDGGIPTGITPEAESRIGAEIDDGEGDEGSDEREPSTAGEESEEESSEEENEKESF